MSLPPTAVTPSRFLPQQISTPTQVLQTNISPVVYMVLTTVRTTVLGAINLGYLISGKGIWSVDRPVRNTDTTKLLPSTAKIVVIPKVPSKSKTLLGFPTRDPTDRPWYPPCLSLSETASSPARSVKLRQHIRYYCARQMLCGQTLLSRRPATRDHGCCYINTQRSRATTLISRPWLLLLHKHSTLPRNYMYLPSLFQLYWSPTEATHLLCNIC